MTTPNYLAGLLMLSLLICTCGKNSTEYKPPRDLTVGERAIVESANDFGLNLFKQVVQSYPDTNICISPLSVAMALGMTYNGARGTTKEAMDSVLGLMGMDITEVNRSYQSLIDLLISMDPNVTFELANSIWYREGFPISQNFVDLNRQYFYAGVNPLNFGDPGAADIINNWIRDNTHGRITRIVEPPIRDDIVMFLIDAIYFLADWKYQFDPDNTQETDFHLQSDSTIACQMMAQEATFDYYISDNYSIVNLPYGDGLFSMAAIMPNDGADINELITRLSAEDIANWSQAFTRGEVILNIPKFQMEFKAALKDQLTGMGMGIAFDPESANFLGMVDAIAEGNLFIDQVEHKTFIKVDEEGTEAAAVTSVVIGVTSIGDEVLFTFNRPFIFLITDSHSNTILFAGKVVCPEWPEG